MQILIFLLLALASASKNPSYCTDGLLTPCPNGDCSWEAAGECHKVNDNLYDCGKGSRVGMYSLPTQTQTPHANSKSQNVNAKLTALFKARKGDLISVTAGEQNSMMLISCNDVKVTKIVGCTASGSGYLEVRGCKIKLDKVVSIIFIPPRSHPPHWCKYQKRTLPSEISCWRKWENVLSQPPNQKARCLCCVMTSWRCWYDEGGEAKIYPPWLKLKGRPWGMNEKDMEKEMGGVFLQSYTGAASYGHRMSNLAFLSFISIFSRSKIREQVNPKPTRKPRFHVLHNSVIIMKYFQNLELSYMIRNFRSPHLWLGITTVHVIDW